MAPMSVEELYERHVRPLPPGERARFVSLTVQELAADADESEQGSQHSIIELHGLGAEIWQGVDAQEYVNQLRAEWDHRP